jgi:hypothetical protein
VRGNPSEAVKKLKFWENKALPTKGESLGENLERNLLSLTGGARNVSIL